MEKLLFVFLTSAPFSGSTLFSILANSHPQIVTVGEMSGLVKSEDPDGYFCSCGKPIKLCPFWKSVAQQMAGRGFAFDPASFDTRIWIGTGNLTRRVLNSSFGSTVLEDLRDLIAQSIPVHRGRLRYLIDRNKALARAIVAVSGKSVFFDASKTASTVRHLSRECDLDFRIVHLVRDVRGIVWSRRRHKGEVSWRTSVKRWMRTNSNIERQLSRLTADRWLRIRYEDLCASPSETMNNFFAFCGLQVHDVTARLSSEEHHIIGNRMRLADASEIRTDDSWRRALTMEERKGIVEMAGSMHRRYGYASMHRADDFRESV